MESGEKYDLKFYLALYDKSGPKVLREIGMVQVQAYDA